MSKANIRNAVMGLKAFIAAGLPAELRAIEAELADGIKLPDPKLHHIGFRDLFTGTDYPLVCYVIDEAELELVQMAEWVNPGIDILVSLVHSKPETLEEILLRYSDAFRNLIASDRSLGGICEIAQISTMDWGHPGGDDKTHAVLAMTVNVNNEIID